MFSHVVEPPDTELLPHPLRFRALAWAPDASFFATGSRDKTVKVWASSGKADTPFELQHTLPALKESVTALDIASRCVPGEIFIFLLVRVFFKEKAFSTCAD